MPHSESRRSTAPIPAASHTDVDERQPRCGMALQIGVEPAQRQQLFACEEADLGPRRVQNRRRVSLRQDEAITVGVLRVAWVVTHLRKEERGHDLGRRRA
jgi:hypothetical protein